VQYEKSYDTFHADYENIYRVVTHHPESWDRGTDMYNTTPGPLVPLIKAEFPEILHATRVFKRKRLVTYNNTSAIEDRVLYVDPEFLLLFSFKLLNGNDLEALKTPNSIILTKQSAEKYFGKEDPTGKAILIDENQEYLVTGIIENTPNNSHIKFDFLTTISTSFKYDRPSYHWRSSAYQTYIRFNDTQSAEIFEDKLNKVCDNHRNNRNNGRFIVQSLANIHLNGNFKSELEKNGDKSQIYTFSIIGIFILLIACFNYVNLTSAYSISRLKAVGIKKVIGATKGQLFFQIIGESAIYVLASTCIALLLVKFSLPYLNSFLQKEISFLFLFELKVLSGILMTIMVISVISGIIPAFMITKYNPVQILKNNIQSSKNKFVSLRSSFVVTQFIISIMLIIGTIFIYQQLKYLQNKDLGYQKENIITTYLFDKNCRVKYPALKNELLMNPNIFDVTVSTDLPNNIGNKTDANWKGKIIERADIHLDIVDSNFLDFYGIGLKGGREFSETGNSQNSYILNQAAIESFDLAVGKAIKINNINGEIAGVIEDIYFHPLHLEIEPMAFMKLQESDYKNRANYLSIKVNRENFEETISYIEETYKQFSPNYPFNYSFFDDTIEQAYLNESRSKSIVQLFSIIAICISCLGVFGLAKYNIEKRVKEIGIRKINGSNVSEVLTMLNKDFVKWVAIAFVIACPIAYYAMNKWLENFAYKTTLSWWIFALAGVLALGIALLTVSWQSWKAATRNPVEALRYE
jgi:putative ABC transport system permease protein